MERTYSDRKLRRWGPRAILASNVSITALAVVLIATPVLAETTVDTVAEVIVTSRKKAENLQDVPLAITAITAAQLEATGASGLEDISQLSPGVTYTSFGAQANAQVIIRGVSDTSGGYSTSQNVSTFFDGIYIKNPGAIDLSLGGVDRVEVVKGPVSATYGRNAFMGAVNYVTAVPGNTFHEYGDYTVGDHGRTKVEAGVSGPIIEGILRGSIAGTYDSLDGFQDSVTKAYSNGHDRKDVLVTLVFTPTNNITITPVFYHGDDFFTQPTTVSYKSNCGGPQGAFTGYGDTYCGDLGQNQIGPYVAANAPGSGASGLTRRVSHLHVDAKFDYDFGTIDVLAGGNAITTASSNEFDATRYGLPWPTVNAISGAAGPTTLAESLFGARSSENDTSLELRYDSPKQNRLRFSFGGYYFYNVSTISNTFGVYAPNVPAGYKLSSFFGPFVAGLYQTSSGQPNGSALNFAKSTVEDQSGFVSGEFDILKNLIIGEEIRTTDETQKLSQQLGGGNYLSAKFTPLTSRTTLTWKPTTDYTVYLSGANGEKSGGFNSTAYSPLDATFAPETDRSYELGIKTTLLDRRLQLNADVFHTDIKGLQQLSAPSAIAPNKPAVLVVKNFGTVNEDGFEAEAKYVTDFGLKLGAGIAIQNPRFGSSSYDTSDVLACANIAGCASKLVYVKNVNGAEVLTTSADPAAVHAINLKGNHLPFASDYTLNFNADYRHALETSLIHNAEMFFRVDYRLEGKQYAELPNFSYVGDRTVINLHAGIERGPWTATLALLNATDDKTPIGGGYDTAANGTLDAAGSATATSVLPDGRTFAAKFSYKY